MRNNRSSSRQYGRFVVALTVAVALGGGAAPMARSGPAAVVTGSFAGKADGAAIAVAVVAGQPAAEGTARTISVYVCNGTSLAVWLTGTTPGNVADLRSADGRVGVHVSLAPFAATGKVGLSGGSGFTFTARRTLSTTGLFDVTVSTTGRLRGTSASGATLTGRLGVAGRLANGAIAVTLRAGGQDFALKVLARHTVPGTYRWVLLPDRTIVGANTRGLRLGAIGGVLHQTVGKHVRITAGGAGQQGYDDAKCGQLAGQFNNLNKQFEAAVAAGTDGSIANRALGEAAQQILDELDDHCLVGA